MANPNIIQASGIYAKNSFVKLENTSGVLLVANQDNSNKVFLVDSMIIANVHGTNAIDVTIDLHQTATSGANPTKLLSTVTVPADASLVAISKDTASVLNENMSIYGFASASGLHIITNWKEVGAI
jgi:hypothetical protein